MPRPQLFQDNPLTFSVTLTENDDRLDCAWFNPVIEDRIDEIRSNERKNRKMVTLKDIAEINGGKRLPKGTVFVDSEANTIPYVRAKDVKNQEVNSDTAIRISKETHHKIQNYQLKKEDIVITIAGTIGEVGLLDKEVGACNFSENIARVRMNEDSVLAKFVMHFLNSEFGRMQAERFTVGSLQYKLSLASCRNIEIYVPYDGKKYDTKTQQKILDKTYGLLERAEQQKKKGLDLVERANSVVMRALEIPFPDEEGVSFAHDIGSESMSRLDVLFNNPFRNNLIANLKKHPHKELGEVAKLQSRKSIAPTDFYKLIELEQIDEKTGRIISAQEVPELGSSKNLLKAGSILISKLQPQNGKIAIVPEEYDGAVGSSELISIVLKSRDVSLEYLWAVLRSDYVLKQWAYELTGSSRMRIGVTELQHTIIPIPDKATQNRIVSAIESKIEDSHKVLQESLDLYEESRKVFLNAVIN